jgi:hypothetical protein
VSGTRSGLPTLFMRSPGPASVSKHLPIAFERGIVFPHGAIAMALNARKVLTRSSNMPNTSHTKAAEAHEAAAKSHRTAAEHHGKNDHKKGHEHSTQAHSHSEAAHKHSTEAHGKSSQQAKK